MPRRSVSLIVLPLLVACGGPVADGPSARVTVADVMPVLAAAGRGELGPLPATVPPLPFPDNPDPTDCGIPAVRGADEPAWLTGSYHGQLVQPIVSLYDRHARTSVIGQLPPGGRVRIELSQANPILDYYRVQARDLAPTQSGCVPAVFVMFTPPAP